MPEILRSGMGIALLAATVFAWAGGYDPDTRPAVIQVPNVPHGGALVENLMGSATRNTGKISGDVLVSPNASTPIKVSNRDVNRIHCPGPIDDVIWSQEKPVSVTPAKNGNVFVKFLVKRQGHRETLATAPADVHIVCNGQVYTMILYPKATDSVTINLGIPQVDAIETVVQEWGALPLEEKVRRLTLALYREEMPSGFSRTPTRGERRIVEFLQGLSIQGQYQVEAPGLGLRATEYRVLSGRAVTLNERDFLSPQFGQVVGITLDPPVLTEQQLEARLFIVERAQHGQ